VGFPVGSRWEEGSPILADSATVVPHSGKMDLVQNKVIVEPTPTTAGLPELRATRRGKITIFNRRLGHSGVPMRPWRGPLPRPRPAPVVVFGDFLPVPFQSDKEIQSLPNPVGNRVSNLGQDELILRARSFGRPAINLDLHRAARVAQQRRPLGLLTPPPCTTPVPKPTYAAMAA
jgi:hypothetical protein